MFNLHASSILPPLVDYPEPRTTAFGGSQHVRLGASRIKHQGSISGLPFSPEGKSQVLTLVRKDEKVISKQVAVLKLLVQEAKVKADNIINEARHRAEELLAGAKAKAELDSSETLKRFDSSMSMLAAELGQSINNQIASIICNMAKEVVGESLVDHESLSKRIELSLRTVSLKGDIEIKVSQPDLAGLEQLNCPMLAAYRFVVDEKLVNGTFEIHTPGEVYESMPLKHLETILSKLF